jgi:predicted Zn-ribbon and HTH transcriptional regulator
MLLSRARDYEKEAGKMDKDIHLKRPVSCNNCGWRGVNGELVAKKHLHCPRCDGISIHYFIADPPEKVQ